LHRGVAGPIICANVHVLWWATMEILKILNALRDPLRLRLLRLLRGQELCVCELVDSLRIPQYAVSRHLRFLRALGLVAARRDGRWMHYRLGDEATERGPAAELLAVLCRHLENERMLRQDDLRLRRRLAMGRTGQCLIASRRMVTVRTLG
jgi:ArsR family transcriptional regulator, arsenate/arsenite/antimonite-responsive transcriptional repressor